MTKKGLRLLVGGLFILLLVGGGFWYAYQPFYSDSKIFPGVEIIGTDVGGMTKAEVDGAIEHKFKGISNKPVSLYYEKNNFVISPQKVNFNINKDELYEKAIALGRGEGFFNRLRERWQLRNSDIDIQPDFKVSEGKIRNELTGIAKALDRQPRNAQYLVKNKKVIFLNEVKGLKVNVDKNVQKVESALINGQTRKYPLDVEVKEALITKKTFEDQGIKGMVAFFTTSFKTSQASRKHNIRVAAAAFNNLILKPQEKFSFNNIIKKKNVAKQYKVAKIIKNNKFVLGDGGGVCQVSTTLYNSVLLAKSLRVIERSHHSVPVSYVPLGQDATVSENVCDFKFRNSFKNSILVLTNTDNNQVSFYILGTPIKEKVNLFSQVLKKEEQGTTEIIDKDLPRGVVKTEKGSPYYEVKVYREVYDNNKLVNREEISHDTYKRVENEIRIGTATPW